MVPRWLLLPSAAHPASREGEVKRLSNFHRRDNKMKLGMQVCSLETIPRKYIRDSGMELVRCL